MKHLPVVKMIFLIVFLSFAGNSPAQDNAQDKDRLTENDVKAFVYQWFSWLDHRVGEFHFMSHLSSAGFEISLPGVTIKDYTGFKKWYDCMRESYTWNSHEVSNVKVNGDYEKGYTVEMTVRWRAVTSDGDSCDDTYHHVWKLQPTFNELIFVITSYRVDLVQ
jgi:hypothetical protein